MVPVLYKYVITKSIYNTYSGGFKVGGARGKTKKGAL